MILEATPGDRISCIKRSNTSSEAVARDPGDPGSIRQIVMDKGKPERAKHNQDAPGDE